jgi:hypothetical protein
MTTELLQSLQRWLRSGIEKPASEQPASAAETAQEETTHETGEVKTETSERSGTLP